MIPQTIDGKIIDKVQGIFLEDGFIGGASGDKLTVSYTNRTGTVKLTFYIANFGATIELDQKVYTWTDKVYITMVAPDLNFNSSINDEIGQKPESIINIRTNDRFLFSGNYFTPLLTH